MKLKNDLRYSVVLALTITVGFFGLILGLLICHRNAVWAGDELSQYVNYLLYFGRTFRSSFASLIQGGGFSFPAYTLNNGYGTDVLVLLAGTIADPFNLPAIVCPGRYVEYLYVFTILARLIGCGLAFSYYCIRRKNSYSATFLASLCYAFCGGIVFIGAVRHPFFLTSAVYLPLILAGIDKVFEDKSPCLFVIAMALQLLSSAIFAYIACLTMLGYCVIKYFAGSTRNKSVRDFVLLVLRFIGLLILSFCIAGVFVAPRFTSLLSQERLGLTRYKASLFEVTDYLRIVTDIIGASSENYAYYFGSVGTIMLIVFLVGHKHFEKKESIVLTLCLGGVIVGMLLPIVGRAFNGFSYSTTRWFFMAQFCCSYVVCRAFRLINTFTKREWLVVAAVATALVAAGLICANVVSPISFRGMAATVFFGVVLVSLPFMGVRLHGKKLSVVLSACVILNLTVVSVLRFLPDQGGMEKNYIRVRTAYSAIMGNSYASAIDAVEDEVLFRYSPAQVTGKVKNASLNHGNNAIDFYRSNYSQPIDDFRTELGVRDEYFFNFLFHGSDSRLALEGLTGSKYFVVSPDDAKTIPYDYSRTSSGKNGYEVWESSHVLPLAFATPNVIDRAVYEDLTMAQKQEALLQGCVVEDASGTGCEQAELELTSDEGPCRVTDSSDALVSDSSITALKGGATVTLEFDGKPSSETYLQVLNLQLEYLSSTELYELRGQTATTDEEKSKLAKAELLGRLPDSYNIGLKCAGINRTLHVGTYRHPQYGGKHSWLINLGYQEDAQQYVTLKFSTAGRYTFDDLSIVAQPVKQIAKKIDGLAQNGAVDTTFDGYSFRAALDTKDNNSMAVVTIPYSKGWTALVDNKEAKVYRADTGFMAVKLDGSGKHEVLMSYTTPGLPMGCVLSVGGIAVGIALDVIFRRKAKVGYIQQDGDE